MHFKTILATGTAAALALIAVNAAPTLSSLEVRSPGTVTEHFNQGELVKRISFALYTVNIGILGGFVTIACQALLAVPNAISGAICAASAFATLAYLLASHWTVVGRDLTSSDPRRRTSMVIGFEQINGHSATHSMAAAYNGNEPLLAAYHPCETSGCYNIYYENYQHPQIGTVHKISQKPRGTWGTSQSKRAAQTDETAAESTNTAEDGTPIFGTYEYWDTNTADESLIGNGNSGEDISDALYTAAVTNSQFENQGYFCVDIIDDTNGGAVPSTGYFDVTAGENQQDPGDEQTYLETCYDDEFGKRRALA